MGDLRQGPRRRWEVRITVGGDTWDDVKWQLRDLLPHIEDHGPECKSVSGSPSSNHVVYVLHDPEMTHERYHEELDRYLATRKESEATK